MVDESVAVKGSPVRSLQKFLESELTPQQHEALLDGLPADFAARFRAPILATESIPVHLMNRVTAEAARIKGEELEAFARRAGREAAADAIRGIYRFFAMVLTPHALLSKASQMWRTLYNRGDMKVDEQTDTGARIRLMDFPSETAGCARVTGWIERLAELSGVKNVEVQQSQCFAKGGPYCEWRVKWS